MLTEYDLIIFDIDNTLAAFESGELLPGTAEWFEQNGDQRVAFCTNQGGVSLRLWMLEGRGFGEPDKYPTEEEARAHVQRVIDQLPLLWGGNVYICFAYQSKASGKWAPTPAAVDLENREWWHTHRKPAPGMLLQAMEEAGVEPERTLMVGDGEEDSRAAAEAGCSFLSAWEFFKRPAPEVTA